MGHEVGRTQSVGYQIGVRRTLPVGEEGVWTALLSPEGLAIWLGGTARLERGEPYTLANGTVGDVRALKEGSHIRLTWQPRGWARPSTLQVRVIPAATGTTLSFHQEQLVGPDEREAMRAHWEGVIGQLATLAADR